MKYSIIFKYIGEDVESKREFDLNNLNRDLSFDNIQDLKDNKEYIKESKIVFDGVVYKIQDDFIETINNEILCCFGVISEDEEKSIKKQQSMSKKRLRSRVNQGGAFDNYYL